MRTFALGAAAAVAVLALAQATVAQAPSGGSMLDHVAGFDHIATDDVQYNLNNGTFTLKDRFTATRKGTEITADRAMGNSKQKMLHAEGNVVVHQNQPLEGSGKTSEFTQKPSTLTCDRLDADGGKKLYTATGNVHFVQDRRDATADLGTLDDTSHNLHMEGHVRIVDSERTLIADSVDYNTKTEQLEAHGNVTIQAPIETPQPGTATPAAKSKKKRLF